MKVYRIRNKETGEFWSNRGRSVWQTIGSAKTAFTNVMRRKSFHIRCEWPEQNDYEIVEYVLVEKDLFEEMEIFYNGYFLGYQQ